MSTHALAASPDPPELPGGARPAWRPGHGFAAMALGTFAVLAAGVPLLPVALISGIDGASGAVAILLLVLVQDAAYVVPIVVGVAVLVACVVLPRRLGGAPSPFPPMARA